MELWCACLQSFALGGGVAWWLRVWPWWQTDLCLSPGASSGSYVTFLSLRSLTCKMRQGEWLRGGNGLTHLTCYGYGYSDGYLQQGPPVVSRAHPSATCLGAVSDAPNPPSLLSETWRWVLTVRSSHCSSKVVTFQGTDFVGPLDLPGPLPLSDLQI